MGSKGSQTTTTSSAPNPQAMQAYQDILAQAQGVAATPYTPYGGELVAGVNPQQSAGIAGINANASFALPYIQQAAGLAQTGATPLTQAQIQQYMSPYTQDVVNATQAQFNDANAQQLQQVKGNAIAQGALGGNREAIAEAETAHQQQMAQAPVIAGLRNQAYSTGLNTALTEQQAAAQGAYSLGNLGVSGENAGLTGANAQVGAGTLQQGTQQALDAANYQQFINRLAYPFQTTQWLAGIGTGVGSQMGGTGSTTGPAPNPMAQWLGLGAAGLGAAGKAGLFSGLGGAAAGADTGAAAAAGMGTAADSAALLAELGAGAMIARGGVAVPRHQTMPETPATLKLQQRQLLAGHRRVQMFPKGTPELPLPRGMNRTENANGKFHYDPRRIDENEIHRLSTAGRENDMLDLGPYSKDDIAKRMRGGEVPVAVVERHPDGTEARAAVGTHATADRQMAAMNRTKSPGHIVRIEDPRETVGHRLRAFGGRVPGFADGGAPMTEAPPTNGVGAVMAGQPYGGHGWIPKMDIARGPGAPHGSAGVAPPAAAPSSLTEQAKEIGSLANLIQNPGVAAPMTNYHPAQQDWPDAPVEEARYGGSIGRASGGVANLPFHNRIMVPGLADGGSPYDTDYFDSTFYNPIRHDPGSYEIAANPDAMAAYSDRARGNVLAENQSYVPLPRSRPQGIAPAYDLPPEIMAGRSRPAPNQVALGYADDGAASAQPVAVVKGDQPSPLDDAAWPQGPRGAPGAGFDDMAQEPRGAPVPPPQGVAPPSGIDLSGNSKLWPSLMAAGFGAMASRSPFLGTAIGEGGLAGMQTYSSERQREDHINSEVKKLSQEAEFAQKRLDLATRPYTEQTADQKAKSKEAERYHDIIGTRQNMKESQSVMVEVDGALHPVVVDTRNNISYDGITNEPLASGAKIVPKPRGVNRTMTPLEIDREARMRATQEFTKPRPDDLAYIGKPDAFERAMKKYAIDIEQARIRHENELRSRYQINPDAPGGRPVAPETVPAPAAARPAPVAPAPAAAAPPAATAAPPRPASVPPDAKPQRSKITGAYRWVAADGAIYSADGVKQ